MVNEYEPRFTPEQYEDYGLRRHYRIIPSPTGDRNVGHVSPQDALELGVSPENNIGISWMIELYGKPEIASGYNPSFKDGVPPADLLSRFILASVEVEANGLDIVITKQAMAWFEIPRERLNEIVDTLYNKYARAEVVRQAFTLLREEVERTPQLTTEFAAGSLAVNEVVSHPVPMLKKIKNFLKKQ